MLPLLLILTLAVICFFTWAFVNGFDRIISAKNFGLWKVFGFLAVWLALSQFTMFQLAALIYPFL